MSSQKVDSNPAWAAPQRQLVPLHLQPGTARSSFARPDSYNLNNNRSLPPSTSPSSPPQAQPQRSSFATKSKSKTKKLGSLELEDELPPTLSIRVISSQDVDAAETSTNFGSSAPPSASLVKRGIPVIVFGFPPGATQSVLQHFSKFGEITENVASSDGQAQTAAAIECGRNWLRITYRDRDAAQRALAQNGHLMPGQYVIGCVPGEPGEYTSTVQQSSTNSLLLDDSDVSLLQDQSMASVLESDHTDDMGASTNVFGNNNNNNNNDTSNSQHFSQQSRPSNNANSFTDANTNANTNANTSINNNISTSRPVQRQILPDKIVPKEMTSQLFKESSPSTNKPQMHMSEINSTRVPEKPAPTSLVGKISNAVAQAFLNWDV